MEDENVKKYLEMIHKMIKRANPKYMSYISKEYMVYSSTSPVIAEAIASMMRTEVNKNKQSPYAIFLDDDGTINLEAMSDISKISNLPQFISQVQELAKYDIDFSKMSADDLIKEGDNIAADLEREIEAELDKEDLTQEDASNAENKAETGLVKLGILAAIGGAISSSVSTEIAKIKLKLSGLKNKSINNQEAGKQESQPLEVDQDKTKLPSNDDIVKSFEEICPKVEVDEREAISKMKVTVKKQSFEPTKRKNTDTYGDGDPDGDDLDI